MNKPTLTAAQIAGDRLLAANETALVTYTRAGDGLALTGKYKLLRTAQGLFVRCPTCGRHVRALYSHPAGRGLCCIGCVSVARKALEG